MNGRQYERDYLNATVSLRRRSGNQTSKDPIVLFMYLLLRDHLPAGVVEGILSRIGEEEEVVYSNGWLAGYAKDCAGRLRAPTPTEEAKNE